MSDASNSPTLQRVYEITVFAGPLEERLPACLIIIHFTQASRQLMTKRGQDVLLAARKIAKRLAFPLDEPMRAGMKVRDTFLSSVEIKPATNGRNDPASQSCVRCFEQRGIFLSNKPDSNELQWAWLKEKCRLTPIMVAGSFRPSLAGFK